MKKLRTYDEAKQSKKPFRPETTKRKQHKYFFSMEFFVDAKTFDVVRPVSEFDKLGKYIVKTWTTQKKK